MREPLYRMRGSGGVREEARIFARRLASRAILGENESGGGEPHGPATSQAYSFVGIPMRGKILASALLVAALAWADVTRAEGALAVGIPQGNPARGFKWDVRVNTPDPAPKVMEDCRAARNPRTGAACKLIDTFNDQCVAVTSNGEPTAPVTAAGWAIAPDRVTAVNRALEKCESMRKGRGPACRLDGEGSLLCDGDAK